LLGQQLFPGLALEPSVVQDSIEGEEGDPAPMLSVIGLLLKNLRPHISKTNKYLPDNSQIGVSPHHGPHNFIVTGPLPGLCGLVANLCKIRAPNGSDQSKVEFSKRQPLFSARFLVVGVPFHSQYLRDATDKGIDEDLTTRRMVG
jgi:fatty acid synthase subunit alpha